MPPIESFPFIIQIHKDDLIPRSKFDQMVLYARSITIEWRFIGTLGTEYAKFRFMYKNDAYQFWMVWG